MKVASMIVYHQSKSSLDNLHTKKENVKWLVGSTDTCTFKPIAGSACSRYSIQYKSGNRRPQQKNKTIQDGDIAP